MTDELREQVQQIIEGLYVAPKHAAEATDAIMDLIGGGVATDEALKRAYKLGFNMSGEGWNGEYPFEGENVEENPYWCEVRDKALSDEARERLADLRAADFAPGSDQAFLLSLIGGGVVTNEAVRAAAVAFERSTGHEAEPQLDDYDTFEDWAAAYWAGAMWDVLTAALPHVRTVKQVEDDLLERLLASGALTKSAAKVALIELAAEQARSHKGE